MKNVTVYRFRDRVAVNAPGLSETLYLTPEQADAIGEALRECAFDTRISKFSNSVFGGKSIQVIPD